MGTDELEQALSRWENEGGAPASAWIRDREICPTSETEAPLNEMAPANEASPKTELALIK
jgi:hypothetical protein